MLARLVVVIAMSIASTRVHASPDPSAAAVPVGHRFAVGYFVSRSIAGGDAGIAHAIDARWQRLWSSGFEIGAGIELGYAPGDESLARLALLPAIAWSVPLAAVVGRVEAAAGPQFVRGRVTLGGIPLQGIETRGFHGELSGALDAPLAATIDLRARGGLAIDGLYPAHHASTRVGPFVEIALVKRW
jgi:hypothetical protein